MGGSSESFRRDAGDEDVPFEAMAAPHEVSSDAWISDVVSKVLLCTRLRLTAQTLADRARVFGLDPDCSHQNLMQTRRRQILEAASEEGFLAAATALTDHLRGCDSRKAVLSQFARGVQLYVEVNARKPGADVAAREYFAAFKQPQFDPDREHRCYAAPPHVETLETIVEVASYIGTAALGGVIGNRGDAIVMAGVKRLRRRRIRRRVRVLFGSTHDRWRERTSAADTPLTEREAVDAAKAAALTRGYAETALDLVHACQRTDNSWIVYLSTGKIGEDLRAHVPAGDPASAKILIICSRFRP